jgi:hypothetical protein
MKALTMKYALSMFAALLMATSVLAADDAADKQTYYGIVGFRSDGPLNLLIRVANKNGNSDGLDKESVCLSLGEQADATWGKNEARSHIRLGINKELPYNFSNYCISVFNFVSSAKPDDLRKFVYILAEAAPEKARQSGTFLLLGQAMNPDGRGLDENGFTSNLVIASLNWEFETLGDDARVVRTKRYQNLMAALLTSKKPDVIKIVNSVSDKEISTTRNSVRIDK